MPNLLDAKTATPVPVMHSAQSIYIILFIATEKNKPLEVIEISKSRAWEVQFDSFITNVLQPAGLELIRWTRVPYLCEGDFSRSFYNLNDVVMVVKPSDNPPNVAP